MSDYTPAPYESRARFIAGSIDLIQRRDGCTLAEAEETAIGEWERWMEWHNVRVRRGFVAEEPETVWQWSYVEKWVDDSGVYERVTFDREDRARRYFRDNVERVEGLNQEFEADDQIIASIEKRRTFEPGPWVPVKQEGAEPSGRLVASLLQTGGDADPEQEDARQSETDAEPVHERVVDPAGDDEHEQEQGAEEQIPVELHTDDSTPTPRNAGMNREGAGQ
jgi:hypothetical protein